MSNAHSRTALLIFAHSLKKELATKSLHASASTNFEIQSHFCEHTLRKLKNTGLPTFHYDEHEQVGATFGEKLGNAIEHLIQKGFENLIVIGNDCPDLSAKDILEAAARIKSNELVLGPDYRGGAYLIGINKRAFKKETFIHLSWSSSRLAESFKEYANSFSLVVHYLSKKADFNSENDLNTYWGLSKSLRSLLNTRVSVPPITFLLFRQGFSYGSHIQRRGP